MRLGRERAVNKAAASSTKGIISTHFSDSLMKLAILSGVYLKKHQLGAFAPQ
jgi:hypothetical protein